MGIAPPPSSPSQSPSTPEDRLKALGLTLPAPPKSVANYTPAVRVGNLLFLSGQGPVAPGGIRHTGKVGADVSVEDAYQHARLTGLNLLAVIQASLGSLSRVKQVVKVLGMVNASPTFERHPQVINGCSDLLVSVFGEEVGRHARSAVGMGSLPSQITVEIELIVAISDCPEELGPRPPASACCG